VRSPETYEENITVDKHDGRRAGRGSRAAASLRPGPQSWRSKLRILQSLWAMERRRADAPECPLQTHLAMIRDAGFDGAGVRFIDPAFATEVTSFPAARTKMIWQAQCYPKRRRSQTGAGTGGAGSAPTMSICSRTCGHS